jgi:type I restriction enzyme S subunit
LQLVEFGTIIEMRKGKKPSIQSKEERVGYLPYVDIKAFETNVIENYTDDANCIPCNEGDILIVCDGSRSGLVGKAINGYVGSTLAKITAKGMSTNYLFYFLQGKYRLLNTKKKGTGTPHLNQELLKKQKLYISTIEEQERIVARIEELFSELDKAVETLKTTKEQLAVYRQAVLKEAFEGITEKVPIRNLASLVTSGSRGWAKYYSDHGARFIRITDLTRDKICLKNDNIQYVDLPSNAEGKRSLLLKNDVLVSITADLGSIALVPSNVGEAYINQHIALIRLKNAEQGEYMAWYLKSNPGQKDLLRNKRGGGKLGLGLDDIRDTPVPVVSDEEALKTVNEIESRLSVCDSIEQTVDTALQQAEAMRQSILKQAFEGRLV